MARYIFDTSPEMAIGYVRNLMRMSVRFGYRVGPTIKVSLKEMPEVVRAEASKTTLNLVVVLLSLMTECMGM